MFKRHWPPVGVAIAIALIIAATLAYPGGTTESASSAGYSWAHNFVSALFGPRALNGTDNTARYIAIPAMLLLCASIGVMFWRISRAARSRFHRKAIEIGGIGAAVYSCLVVTPMHDLMVGIGLLFSFTVLLTTTHMLYRERRQWLFVWGLACIALALTSATMYYGKALYGVLPIVQKLGISSSIGWVLAVYYAMTDGRSPASARDAEGEIAARGLRAS